MLEPEVGAGRKASTSWIRLMHTGGRVRAERRLAAIPAADVAGYSRLRLIGTDEEGTLLRLRSIRAEETDPEITEQHGTAEYRNPPSLEGRTLWTWAKRECFGSPTRSALRS
jgi:hypothetical protein